MRKRARALTGAIVLTLALALGLVAASPAGADEAPPERATVSLWAGIEAWFQDLLAAWSDPERLDASYYAEQQTSDGYPVAPNSQDGGSGGTSTTDGGPANDPDG